MANSQDFDFMSVGKHCAQKDCKRLDYLPFTCDHCTGNFCLEHKHPEAHSCHEIVDKDSKLPKCPLCNKYVVKGRKGEDDNRQVEYHIQSGCKELIVKKRKKSRCTYDRCREVNLIPLHCEKCYRSFCVKHRHPGDHNCFRQNQSRILKV